MYSKSGSNAAGPRTTNSVHELHKFFHRSHKITWSLKDHPLHILSDPTTPRTQSAISHCSQDELRKKLASTWAVQRPSAGTHHVGLKAGFRFQGSSGGSPAHLVLSSTWIWVLGACRGARARWCRGISYESSSDASDAIQTWIEILETLLSNKFEQIGPVCNI